MATEKARTLRDLTDDDLKKKESDLRESLFNLRFQQKVGQLENPLKLRTVRKDLARVITVAAQRQKPARSKATTEVK